MQEKWSKKYSECLFCHSIEKKYMCKGMCTACYRSNYYQHNKEKYKASPEKNKERCKKWRNKNPEKFKRTIDKWHSRNYKKYIDNIKKWQKDNPEKYREYQRKSIASRLKRNPNLKLRCIISASVYSRLKKNLSSKNGKATWDFLPYTVEELKIHIEKQFESWMNWNNWGRGKGKWNIDHIKSHSSFNYTSIEDKEFLECWALENLRPLDAIENIKKSNQTLKNINQNL